MTATDDENKYTLDEAKREIARRQCHEQGHDWNVVCIIGRDAPVSVTCTQCGITYDVKAP